MGWLALSGLRRSLMKTVVVGARCPIHALRIKYILKTPRTKRIYADYVGL